MDSRSETRRSVLATRSLQLALVLAGAFALRVLHLGRLSLELDESATWWNASYPTWGETLFAEVNHGPVWWIVTRLWIGAFGDSEAALRMPAALLGVLSIVLGYFLARRLLDPPADGRDAATGTSTRSNGTSSASGRIALLVAGLASLNGFWIEYSQEARMYSALLAESLGLSLLLLRWIDRRRISDLVAYGALAALALYTHYFAIWPILGHAAFALISGIRRGGPEGRRLVAGTALAQAAAVAALLPWILRSVENPQGVASGGRFNALERLAYSLWRIGVGPSLAAIDRPRVDAGLGAFVREEWLLIGSTALVWAGAIGTGILSLRRDTRARDFVATGILVPLVGMLAVQPRLPLMHEKYLIFLAPLLLLLAVLGAWRAPGGARRILLGGLVGLHVLAVAVYHMPSAPGIADWIVRGHPWGKEQWREAHAWVRAESGPGDTILLYPFYLNRPWRYYDRGRLPIHELHRLPETPEELRRVVPQLGPARGGLLVLSHESEQERAQLLRLLADLSGVPPEELDRRSVRFPRQWGVRVVRWGSGTDGG